MSLADAHTPRLFLIRHGETTWSQTGRYTGVTDLPLLPEGESRVSSTARTIYGPGKLIDPAKVSKVFISPRLRAQRTWELYDVVSPRTGSGSPVVETTDRVAEWGYGDYEGLVTAEIRELRRSRGHDQASPWDIWRDGAEGPGGELPDSVSRRVDSLIEETTALQSKALSDRSPSDVVVVAHGHILRAFIKRWLGLPLESTVNLMLEPGGVCGLSYSHGNIEERAVLVGMSFPDGR